MQEEYNTPQKCRLVLLTIELRESPTIAAIFVFVLSLFVLVLLPDLVDGPCWKHFGDGDN